jgi:hypothetical protein
MLGVCLKNAAKQAIANSLLIVVGFCLIIGALHLQFGRHILVFFRNTLVNLHMKAIEQIA